MTHFAPADAAELRDLVAAALAAEQPLEIIGGGSKRGLGRPVQAAHTLDLSRLAGIVAYEPNELVLTARAGTPLAAIEAALGGEHQMLAFEPPDWRHLLGSDAAGPTLGGVIACNLGGPRRFKSGAARDHFLGFHAVSGRGEAFKSGGKVVKNVTGYDLCKLMAGAFGTLAVLSEITVKVLPRPEKTRSVLLFGLDEAAAVAAMAQALNAPHEVSGAAHLPPTLAARSAVPLVAGAGAGVTALRLEGPGPSVEHRCASLRRDFAAQAASEELHSENSRRFWREIAEAEPLRLPPEPAIWRLSLPPASTPALLAALRARLAFAHFLDWGGGLVWLAVAAAEDAGAAAIRAALAASGGHATLIRAPAALRAAVPVFEPAAGPLAALQARVKDSFDPKHILNPGRMVQGL